MRFLTPRVQFTGTLDRTLITQAIIERLPISSVANRWGDEIYFDVPVQTSNTKPVRDVRIGDIGYWPDGPSLCIFFGRTPASKSDQPRAGSGVTIIGHTDASPDLLRSVDEGTPLTVELAAKQP